MIAFQFSTKVTADGDLALPPQYRQSIPPGSQLQVVLLVESSELDTTNHITENDAMRSLDEYVAYLRQHPLSPSAITPTHSTHGEYLARSLATRDPNFDEAEWNAQWDALEAQTNANEDADEEKRLREILSDLQP